MTYTPTKILTFDKFIAQYGDDPSYELADGELIEMEPTGPHETVGGKLDVNNREFSSLNDHKEEFLSKMFL
jgi:Uma2 family endonuclease